MEANDPGCGSKQPDLRGHTLTTDYIANVVKMKIGWIHRMLEGLRVVVRKQDINVKDRVRAVLGDVGSKVDTKVELKLM